VFLLIFICFLNYQSIEASSFNRVFNSWPEGKDGIIVDIALTVGTAYALKKTIDTIKEKNKVHKEEANSKNTKFGKNYDGSLSLVQNYAYNLGSRISHAEHMCDLWIAITFPLGLFLTGRLLIRSKVLS